MMKVYEVVGEHLIKNRVKVVFGVPGTHIYHIYSILEDSDVEVIVNRHESNSVYSADLYGRITGYPGVSIVTAGPGALNGATGLGQAFAASSPVLYITGEVSTEGYYSFHGLDIPLKISDSLSNIVKASHVLLDPDLAGWYVDTGYILAYSGRKGPVHLSIPYDVLKSESKESSIRDVDIESYEYRWLHDVIKRDLDRKKVIFLIGPEGAYNEVREDLTKLISKNNVYHASTPDNIGFIPQDIGVYLGFIEEEFIIYPPLKEALKEAEAIIAIGLRPESPESRYIRKLNRNLRWLYILPSIKTRTTFDYTVEPPIVKKVENGFIITGDLKRIIELIGDNEYASFDKDYMKLLKARFNDNIDSIGRYFNRRPIHQGYIAYKLMEKLHPDTLTILDAGGNELWMRDILAPFKRIRYVYGGSFGTIGYSFGAAIGGYYADVYKDVVSITGDGSFLMSIMELQTISRYQIPVKIIVINDGEYGILKYLSRRELGSEIETYLGRVDFANIAREFGVDAMRVDDPRDLDDAINKLIMSKEPYLIDIWVSAEDIPELLKL